MIVIMTFILYARPIGQAGAALKGYWETVKQKKALNHLFVRQYPPHVTLTSFFSTKEINLEKALNRAIAKTKSAKDIAITGLKQSTGFDRLEVQSKYLEEIAKRFAKRIGLPSNMVKKDLHLTLKQKTFKIEAKNEEIHKLQKELMKKLEHSSATKWTLCLYKSEKGTNQEQKLTLLKKTTP